MFSLGLGGVGPRNTGRADEIGDIPGHIATGDGAEGVGGAGSAEFGVIG